jgi:hypothetical protein
MGLTGYFTFIPYPRDVSRIKRKLLVSNNPFHALLILWALEARPSYMPLSGGTSARHRTRLFSCWLCAYCALQMRVTFSATFAAENPRPFRFPKVLGHGMR